jgi:hypothetical protein
LPGNPSVPFQAVDAFAGRADADGEFAGEVADPGAGVRVQVAQELVLRGDDPVPLAQPVVELVVQARLTADQVGEQGLRIRP